MNQPPVSFLLRRVTTILAVVTLTLTLLAGLTGVLLAFYYEPVAGQAYNSLQAIDHDVSSGLLVHSIHNITGNGLIVVSLIEIFVMFLGRRFIPSWLVGWLSGILLTLTGIGLGWTAMILNWDQLGYWRFRIELGFIEAIPVIGAVLRNVLIGGDSVNTTSVQHLYTLHSYILAVGAVLLAIIHLVASIYAGRTPMPVERVPVADDVRALEQVGKG